MSTEPQQDQQVAERVFVHSFGSISQYVDILASRGIDWGLIGPRETDRLWDRHVLNSVAIADLISEGSHVADVGSGAGLPGIPLAILRPDVQVTLIEPLQRRVGFLELTVDELGLGSRVTVVRARADEVDQQFDVVTSRALAPLPRLLDWCVPLLAGGGRILAIKGRSAEGEVQESAFHLQKFGVQADVLSVRADPAAEATSVVRVARG